MLTPAIVRLTFRLVLGRPPENEAAITANQGFPSAESLKKAMVATSEFERKQLPSLMGGALNTLRKLPKRIDYDVSPEQIELLFERLRAQWTKLGETEPHWSVLSDPIYKAATFAENEEKFYRTALFEMAQITDTFKRTGMEMNKAGTAFELGCGTGRVTHALADEFAKVIGADVSPGNLRLCEEKMRALNKTNVECLLLKSPGDIEQLPPIDFFFSTIVLQHNPPPVMHYFLSKIFSKITEGGAVLFQLPTHTPNYAFDVNKYLAAKPNDSFDMHALPMHAVFALLAKYKFVPLEVLMDTRSGDLGSHTFFAVREREVRGGNGCGASAPMALPEVPESAG